MITVPDYYTQFHNQFNGSSLPFVLFYLAPPSAALGMLDKKIITDLNELSEKSVSLLALKASQSSTGKNTQDLPTWYDFEEHGENVWNAAGIKGANTDFLIASMIFQGANPWITWNLGSHQGSDSFFSLMCLHDNVKMIKFLCTHPNLPSVSELENLRVRTVVQGDHHYYNAKEQDFPLLHYLANRGNTDIMDVLLKMGYDPNLKDENGRTALFYIKQPSTAKHLVDHKALVSVKDNSGVGVAEFWGNWVSTAAKKAELNAIVVEQFKESMSLTQLQDLQKPALLNEILSGTKTGFMSILRKGKFKSTVEFNTPNGSLNLLTVALLRTDEKSGMFVKSFDQTGVSWSHTPWPAHPNVTNALVSKALATNETFPTADQILADQYGCGSGKRDFAKYQYDLMCAYQALGETGIGVHQVLKFLLYALEYPYYSAQMASHSHSYNSNAPYDFASFAKIFSTTHPFKEKLSLMDQHNTPSALRAVLHSCLKDGERVQNLYLYAQHTTHFVQEVIQRSETSSDWARTLPYVLRLIVAQQWKDKGLDSLCDKMVNNANLHVQSFKQEDLDILKPISNADNAAVTPMISVIQKGMILNGIEKDGGASEAPSVRRKM